MKHLISSKTYKYIINNRDLYILEYLRNELNSTKSKIDRYYNEWESVKKIIHDYEYVYYGSYRKKNISSVAPVSRSYFKFREIFYDFNMNIENINNVCNLAEAPGGFIESLIHLSNGKKLTIYANSLLSSDKSIPMWNNKIKRYKINTLYGKKNNGDICDFDNIISIIHKLGRNSCELVTGDGGFDYSKNFNKQEVSSFKIIFCEIVTAISNQAIGGNFICKLFDTYSRISKSFIHLLCSLYKTVLIHKPVTSRPANSEKYIICKGFIGIEERYLESLFISINLWNIIEGKGGQIKGLFKNDIPDKIDKKIDELNTIHYKEQKQSIEKTINLIKNKPNLTELNLIIGNQVEHACNWCKKYDIPINNSSTFIEKKN